MFALIFIGTLVIGIFAVEMFRQWRFQTEWRRHWQRGDDE